MLKKRINKLEMIKQNNKLPPAHTILFGEEKAPDDVPDDLIVRIIRTDFSLNREKLK